MPDLIQKTVSTLKNEGVSAFVQKSKNYVKKKISGRDDKMQAIYADVLFINGCCLPHPYRYRVQHQREQLAAFGITSSEIYYTELDCNLVYNYRTIIIYRAELTPQLQKFIDKAHYYNKKVFFDVDDLIIDTKYTDLIPYVKNMPEQEKAGYDKGVQGYHDTLIRCDGVITTTEGLARELGKYIDNVFINRNTVSETMVLLSQQAAAKKVKESDDIILGYFSGSITHNDDFALILPAIIKLFEKYDNVKLLLVGELTLPQDLYKYKSRIIIKPFVDWTKLPELIAQADINLVPLLDNVFNEAKSENKWVEAALVKVPTIASNVGAFKKMIQHGKNGVLCAENQWQQSLEKLIENSQYRASLAGNACDFVMDNYVAAMTGNNLRQFIIENRNTSIAMLLPSLNISGGVMVALKHCEILRENGWDVTIVNMDLNSTGKEKIAYREKEIAVISYEKTKIMAAFDKTIATMWWTNYFWEKNPVREKYYLVQNFETDFYPRGSLERIRANSTYCQDNIQYLTISTWCQDWLYNKFRQKANYAPNGLERELFYPQKRSWDNKIRILIEGDSESAYKNVDESFKIIADLPQDKYEIYYVSYNGKAKSWYRVDKFFHKVAYDKMPDIYRQCHILVKSSILESFSYPPLEMMATGGFVVARLNGGNKEYLQDNINCLIYDSADITTAAMAIERISNDVSLRQKLYAGAMQTADERDWHNCQSAVSGLYK